jgi:protein TonB
VPSAAWSQVIPLSREQFAAADISNVPRTQSGDQGAESGSASGSERGDTEGPGTGPNGETLYNAEWHRRPTRAELAFYLPKGGQQTGWGMIACQTVPGNRVDDCREIAQSPAGSGLAGAVRQAAWQFRVRPPRVGGRPLIGAWVRIRIEYTVNGPE